MTLLAILIYRDATGIFSSRRLERATYDSVAFRDMAAGSPPDHDSLATFRRRLLDELSDRFVQILERPARNGEANHPRRRDPERGTATRST